MITIDGRLTVVSGASRCGKTSWVLEQIAGKDRVFAWDPEDQWAKVPGFQRITSSRAMIAASQKPGPLKVAYVAGGDLKAAFDLWAGCVFYSVRHLEALDVIAEELSDVTTQSKAPGKWGILLRRGLKRGANIYAISQRWAEADKTAMGNASEFVIFRQVTGDDSKYMARKTRVPQAEIDTLAPFEFIRYDTGSFQKTRNFLPFVKKIPEKSAAKSRKKP